MQDYQTFNFISVSQNSDSQNYIHRQGKGTIKFWDEIWTTFMTVWIAAQNSEKRVPWTLKQDTI